MVDFSMAFDRVDILELLQRLRNKGLPLELQRIIGSVYHNCEATVKSRKGISTKIPINTGVQQRDPLSPLLFCLYIANFLEVLDKPHLNNNSKGLRVGEKMVKATLYADDMALVTTEIWKMRKLLFLLSSFRPKSGLVVNKKKTKWIMFSKSGEASNE